jgi:hypothetical protein
MNSSNYQGTITRSRTTTRRSPERICVGRHAWLEHLGIGSHHLRTVIPWNAVVRIEGNRIIVNDDAAR